MICSTQFFLGADFGLKWSIKSFKGEMSLSEKIREYQSLIFNINFNISCLLLLL